MADDGGDFVIYDAVMPGWTMLESTYPKWWNHYRGMGFSADRDIQFPVKEYSRVGIHTAAFMAANAAATTGMYSCPIYRQRHNKGNPMYSYKFTYNPDPDNLVWHSSELPYLWNPLSSGNMTLSV